jgi:hypothetical protein
MTDSYNLSVYIPRINNNVTEEFVKQSFMTQHIGIVNRVDFVPIISPAPGLADSYESAFVHFDGYYYDERTDEMYEKVFEQGKSWKFYPIPSSTEYWLLLKNNNPVHPTKLNIHQLAENHRILEESASIQSQYIQELYNTINFIKYKHELSLTRLEEELAGAYELINQMRYSLVKPGVNRDVYKEVTEKLVRDLLE